MKNKYKAECKKGNFGKNNNQIKGFYLSKSMYQQKNKTDLLLSIIMVTYNAEAVVEKTLNSVFEQTFDQYELIVIDGGSTDNTIHVLKNYSDFITCLISEPDQGIYDAMNKGLVAAKGQYVQFLNAGDYFAGKLTLKTIFNQIVGNPMLIYGDINILHLDGKTQYQPADAFTLDNLQRRGTGVLCHQAIFMLRERAPLYILRYRYKAELNWYFDIVEKENFTYQHCPVPVVYYSLGGYGYKNFIKNRLDWIFLVLHRYGIKTLWDSRLILFLCRNSLYRYPMLKTIQPYLAILVRILRKLFRR
jgi:glycosyltransferase involved in cell wall biosynthesis